MAEAPASPELVNITVDGRAVQVPKGALLIQAAQDEGAYIPRFCWHERMKPVGMCRQCLVEIEGQRGLPPACTTPVAEGMVVKTQVTSELARKAQEGVLEFLLINHPLDCPVCDRGGECPLQDHTLAHGPGESRFIEEKRHFAKPIPISELVDLDRERCIQCARCTRFADEIAGDPLISFVDRGGHTQVLTYPDDPFTSYFSGNTVQICPVGALTARPYRFRARPWDLQKVETSCNTCAVQCRTELHSTTNQLVRMLGVDSDAVNHSWLCDKGRFGYEWVHSPDRLTAPAVRQAGPTSGDAGELQEVSWPAALNAAADGLQEVIRLHGAESVAVIGGARGTNEGAYTWARLAKSVLRTDHVDAQLGDGLPAEVVLGVDRAQINDVDRAKAIVVLSSDLKEELPVLFLRLRRAAVELRVPLIEIGYRDTGLSRYATHRLRARPGEIGELTERFVAAANGTPTGDETIDAAAKSLQSDRAGDVVVVLGRPSLAEPGLHTVRAAASLRSLAGVRFLSALRRGNVHGALDMGLAPGVLPGRVTLDDARDWYTEAWGAVPASKGHDTEGILRAAAAGQIHALVLLGADPVSDFPDRRLAQQALDAVGFVVAVDAFVTRSSRRADVVLPPTVWGESSGTLTNLEGRVQSVNRKVTAVGSTMDDWRIAVELAARFDVDFELDTLDDVQAEIAWSVPAYFGVEPHVIRGARDGVVVPLEVTTVELRTNGQASPPAVAATEDAEAEDAAADDEMTAQVPPDLHRWDGRVEAPAVPPADSYAVRLVVGRDLYDGGMIVTHGPALAPLASSAELRVSSTEASRLGINGTPTPVRIVGARGSMVIPAVVDRGVAQGVAVLAHLSSDDELHDLVDVDAPVTEVRLESAKAGEGR